MFEVRKYPEIGETIHYTTLENGLAIYIDVKAEFQKSYAFFATKYGGMDLTFQLDGAWQTTPAGVAHFLEHKMFDTEDGNALQDLAANGASPNAFTSSAMTGYYFESTQGFYENLKTLLSFVSIPWFTPESVEKEQGIIGQEIQMIEDNPQWQVFMKLMEALYHHHPVRVSVAGSRSSIAEITHQTLYDCHKVFYHPSNMVLTVAGNVDPEQVVAIAQEILPKGQGKKINREYGEPEPPQVSSHLVELEMEVATPIFQLGFKVDPVAEGDESLRQRLVGELAMEALVGTSSPLYAKLYSQGLINRNFGCGYEHYTGAALLVAGGESVNPQQVTEAILAESARLSKEGIDPQLWSRLKKAAYGSRVRGLNSFENICIEGAQGHFEGIDPFAFPQVFEAMEQSHVEAFLGTYVVAERHSLAVIKPKEA